MPNNVTLPGTGSVIATDTVGAAQMQIIKLDVGDAGASSPVSNSNPLPVVSALPAGASTSAKQDTINTSVNAVVTAIGGLQTALPLPTGASTSTKQDSIVNAVNSVNTEISIVNTTVSAVNTSVDLVNSTVNAVNSAIALLQTTLETSLPLPTGASTAANQTGQNNAILLVNSSVNAVNTELSVVNTNLSAVNTEISIVNSSVTSVNTSITGLQSSVNSANTNQMAALATLNASINASLPAGENHLGVVSGTTYAVANTLTRPANTTAYSALNAVTDSTSAPSQLTFVNMARVNQGSGYITKARLSTNQSGNTARFRLHLFHTTVTSINDGSAYTQLFANASKEVGYIDFDGAFTEGSGSDSAISLNASTRLAFICDSANKNLYGILETLDAFTPTSGQQFYIELTVEAN